MLMKELHHKSVMIEEVLSILKPSDGKIYIDGTLGAGGHSKRILESARSVSYTHLTLPTKA